MQNAWKTTTGSEKTIVAILDTGFDLDHPDLEKNTWVNTREIPGNGMDDDANGFVDDVHGWDFVDEDATPEPTAFQPYEEGAVSHGTVIAGIVGAATNNAEGIAGINWHVKLMNVRILDNMGVGSSESARKGIEYAVRNGADVINLSFTGHDHDPLLESAIQAAVQSGALIVAAVGNTKDGGIDIDQKPIYPACDGHGSPNNGIIGVASTDQEDVKSVFSNFGSTCTDLAAPGEDILSTVYQNDLWGPFAQGAYQDAWSGTSMAAPMVSGAAALIFSVAPHLTPAQVKNVLRLSADPITVTGAAQGNMGAGKLNIASALALVKQLYPAETEANTLVKLPCSATASVNDPCKAVYFYGSDGKRHAFPNDKVFFSWYTDFSSVKEVSPAFLSSLPLGKNVTYRPGIRLVKFQTVPTVFAVSAKGTLRPIASEDVAARLYGATWNKQVDDIADVFYGNYLMGTRILTESDFSVVETLAAVTSLNQSY